MYNFDKVLEKHPTVDVLCVDRGKLDALAFPNDPHASQGFSCRICCLKCCGKHNGSILYILLIVIITSHTEHGLEIYM